MSSKLFLPDGRLADDAVKASDVDLTSNTILGTIGGGTSPSVAKDLSEAEFYHHIAMHHPYIGSCVRLIANSMMAAGFDIITPGIERDQDETDRDPIVIAMKTVCESINPEQDVIQLGGSLQMDLDIVGRAYGHWLRLPSGEACGMERIDARTMAPVVAEDGKSIKKFVQKISVNGKPISASFPVEDIVYFKLPGGDPLLGAPSLLEQLDLTYAVDVGARRHAAAYFRNGARHGTILVNESATKEQIEHNQKMMDETRAGADKSYRPLVLGGKWQVTTTKAENGEEFGSSMDRARQEVCSVYHVPESKLKTTEGALGGNGKEQDDETFHEECVQPRANYLWDKLTRAFRKEFPAFATYKFVPKGKYSVSVSMIAPAMQLLQAGGTINEARAMWRGPKLQLEDSPDVDLDMPYTTKLGVRVDTPAVPVDNNPETPETPENLKLGTGKPKPGTPAAKKARRSIVAERRAARRAKA